ncbi:MAG: hypothetical protein Q8M29_05150 [Bacteroidota bacterium]|nr:hypothetical protein [Bacteroidota bacterium]
MKTPILIMSLVVIFSYGYKEETKTSSQIQTANTPSSGITINNEKNVTPLRMRSVHTGPQLRTIFIFELPGNKTEFKNEDC